MSEGLDAVDGDDRDIILVALKEISVAFNIDLFERIFTDAAGGFDSSFCVVAQMTTWATVDDHVSFS